MSVIDSYPRLMEGLHGLRRQWRALRLAEGAAVAVAIGLAAVAVAVAADNLLKLSGTGRAVTALLMWGAAALAFAKFVVERWLEDRRDDFFAAMVEQRHPELSNTLINALQLGRSNGYGSPRLVEAIVEDAVRDAAELELADCLERRTLRRNGVLLAGAAGIVVLYALAAGARFGNGLSRVLAPWANIAAFTATQIVDVTPGDQNHRVLEQTPVTIEARTAGKPPHDARLYQRSPGGSWTHAAMATVAGTNDRFRSQIPAVKESFDYYVRAGDGRSGSFRLDVVARPQIERVRVTYTPPAYTGLSARHLDESNGDLQVLAGSTVKLEFIANKPLQRAVLAAQWGNAQIENRKCERGADDRTWTANLDVQTAGTYQVQIRDTDGFDDPHPVQRAITLTRDTAPTVAITVPGRDIQAKPQQTLSLVIEARDDYGLAEIALVGRVNDEKSVRTFQAWTHTGKPQTDVSEKFDWKLAELGLKTGDVVQYWVTAVDRNNVTGPGHGESRRFSIFVVQPEAVVAKLEVDLSDYAAVLEELLRLQRKTRAETTSGQPFVGLVTQQTEIRTRTRLLASVMHRNAMPAMSIVQALERLHAGLMADAVRLLESGRDTTDAAKAQAFRDESLPVQDKIIAELAELLARLQRAEQARQALKKIEKTDKPAHQQLTQALDKMINDLGRLTAEEKEVAEKLEKMPKKPVEEFSKEDQLTMEQLEALHEKLGKWAKGTVDNLAKLPTGFVDDFGLREDVNRVFEEVEKVAQRSKAEKLEVALEDLGASMATKMLEDLELWMPNSPDSLKWVLEEPLSNKPLNVPEMTLPGELEDLIGDLMQKAEEFDEEADDITSAWGDNLNQAGWDVMDGPISSFSAKGKTGNDLPNQSEITGRSGDGRRGKSSGQMVGDTARNLQGRDTPARLGNERYEPGNLKQEAAADPKGATGGGKKAGSGRLGLQGGTPPDFARDMQRLSEKQAALREKAEKVAKELDTAGITSRRLVDSIQLMRSVEQDLRDLRYEDAARKRRVAIHELRSGVAEMDRSTGLSVTRARDLPADLRDQMLQSSDEGLPAGYESLVKSYFRALSEAEK